MMSETQKTPLPNGNAEHVEEATVAVRVGRLENRFDKFEVKLDDAVKKNVEQDEKIRWRAVAQKTAAGIALFLSSTANPEFRATLKAAWDSFRHLFVFLMIVGIASVQTGCAHANKGLEIAGEIINSGEHLAEKSCDFAKDPDQYTRCVESVHNRFVSAKLAYQTARTAEAALSYVCRNIELIPAELQPAIKKVCEQ